MKTIILAGLLLMGNIAQAQFFKMKKAYTGGHFAFSNFNPDGINQFVVQFNQMWGADLETGFSQYKGNERGQTFTTSGMRFIFGNDENMKYTFSTDYGYGFGGKKNEAVFKNGVIQHMDLKFRNNQINFTFGITKNKDKVWLEGIYSTNLGKVILEYSTEHLNGVQSFGTEYKLNGVYTSTIKTMEFGAQATYKYKKYVMYARVLFPAVVIGPKENERNFVDERSGYSPNDFPANYNSYISNPQGYASTGGALQSTGFKGLSYGFGIFYLIGKDKSTE